MWSGSATPAFGARDVHHVILFAVGTASCPSITLHPERRLGPATPAFAALDVHHLILFAVGTASCPSITWHPQRRLGSATPASAALDVHHPILLAVGTARWSCVMLKSKRWLEHTSAHTGAKRSCQCANVRLSVRRASIGQEAVGRAVVALSSQNRARQEQQPACSLGSHNHYQKRLHFNCGFLSGNNHSRSSRTPRDCPRTISGTSPAKGRRPGTGHGSSGAWQRLRRRANDLAIAPVHELGGGIES